MPSAIDESRSHKAQHQPIGQSCRRLTALLSACRSVKVKRLFFVFAGRHGHAWFKHLDADSVDLGSGGHSLVKGGRLHPLYNITVSQDLMSDKEGAANGG